MKEKSYHTIKDYTLDQTKIKICIKNIPTEEQIKRKLTQIYDAINEIADSAKMRGIDTSKWFYTNKQLKKLKEDPNNNFI